MTHQGHLSVFFWVMNLSVEVLWRLVQSDMIMHSLHQELGHQKAKLPFVQLYESHVWLGLMLQL